eukprot:3521875-Rhodomonas_salina.1
MVRKQWRGLFGWHAAEPAKCTQRVHRNKDSIPASGQKTRFKSVCTAKAPRTPQDGLFGNRRSHSLDGER